LRPIQQRAIGRTHASDTTATNAGTTRGARRSGTGRIGCDGPDGELVAHGVLLRPREHRGALGLLRDLDVHVAQIDRVEEVALLVSLLQVHAMNHDRDRESASEIDGDGAWYVARSSVARTNR